MVKQCGIYKIENIINGIVYIGQSRNIYRRFCSHKYQLRHGKCANIHLQRSWNKYGEEAFEFSIIELCCEELLNDREVYWISEYKSTVDVYNQSKGGAGISGYRMTDEQREKISTALKGKPKTKEHIEIMRQNTTNWIKEHGNPRSIKIVCLNTGEVFDNTIEAGKKFGINHSVSIRYCCAGHNNSCGEDSNGVRYVWRDYNDYIKMSKPEIEEAIRIANCKGKHSGKRVECITTGEVFDTMLEASAKYCANYSNIGSCCNGKRQHAGKDPKTGEKLSWRFVS